MHSELSKLIIISNKFHLQKSNLNEFNTLRNRAHLQDILLKQERPGIDQTKVMTIFAAGKFADPNLRYINSQGKKYNDLSDVEILSMLTNFFDWFKPGLLYEYMTFKFYQLQAYVYSINLKFNQFNENCQFSQ